MPPNPQNSQRDKTIVVMGPTGTGKSTFVDYATGQTKKGRGPCWKSSTNEIKPFRTAHPTNRQPVVFVDTPGFDHTEKSDAEILAMMAEWLMQAEKKNANLAGILYFHRITDNRMNGSAMKNLRLFSGLCGRKAMPHVVIVTTMWGKVNRKEADEREDLLKREVWQGMLGDGCKSARFEDTYESAWNIVGSLMQKNSGTTLLIQKEMGALGKPLDKTQAGLDVKQETEMAVPNSLLMRIRGGFSRLFGWGH